MERTSPFPPRHTGARLTKQCYWATEEGNGTAIWADPLLTPAGDEEAYKANAYLKTRLLEHGMPAFESYYTSPLSRCVLTADITFADLPLPATHPFEPIIKENLREGVSAHTCNRRSTASEIAALAPDYFHFEPGFPEEDPLWRVDEKETPEAQDERSFALLDDIFRTDEKAWLSFTSHSGEIASLLRELAHQEFRLATGQIIPVLVKAKVVTPKPTETIMSWLPYNTCLSPPVTSIAGGDCVCSETMTLASSKPTMTA